MASAEDSYLQAALDAASANSAWQANQAQINRQWETEMSNTAHQREVMDLAAAGLNPILSANSGARWGNVGNATADTANSQALANMATTVMNNRAMVQAAAISAGAQVAAAAISAQAARDVSSQTAEWQRQANYVKMSTNPWGIISGTAAGLTSGLADALRFSGSSSAQRYGNVINLLQQYSPYAKAVR